MKRKGKGSKTRRITTFKVKEEMTKSLNWGKQVTGTDINYRQEKASEGILKLHY